MKSVGIDEESVARPITGQVKSTLDASYRGGGTRDCRGRAHWNLRRMDAPARLLP
jgi:hypothetical protein